MFKSLFAFLLIPAGLITAQELKPISLPAPRMTGGKPLMEALKARKSTREFAPDKLSQQTLSNLLWAAWGVNREDGRRTAPSASDRQEIDVYVVMENGTFVYDAKGNALKPVASGDLRKATGPQPFVTEAPLTLVYVADLARYTGGDSANNAATSNTDAGFIAQNVYLFGASEGLAVVVRGSVTKPETSTALKLRPNQLVILAQTVGYFKKP
jgi:nitroreductase